MATDIFVGVMIVGAVVAGVWCWWVDNSGETISEKRKNSEAKKHSSN